MFPWLTGILDWVYTVFRVWIVVLASSTTSKATTSVLFELLLDPRGLSSSCVFFPFSLRAFASSLEQNVAVEPGSVVYVITPQLFYDVNESCYVIFASGLYEIDQRCTLLFYSMTLLSLINMNDVL